MRRSALLRRQNIRELKDLILGDDHSGWRGAVAISRTPPLTVCFNFRERSRRARALCRIHNIFALMPKQHSHVRNIDSTQRERENKKDEHSK